MKSIFAFIVGLLLTVEAQVMLPHRHAILTNVASAPITYCPPDPEYITNAPPYFSDALIWLSVRTLMDEGNVDGAALGDWHDATSNGVTFTPSTSPPHYTTNDGPCSDVSAVVFDGVTQFYHQKNTTPEWWVGPTSYHLFIVLKHPTNWSDLGGGVYSNAGGLLSWGTRNSANSTYYPRFATNIFSSFMSDSAAADGTWDIGVPVKDIHNLWHVLSMWSATDDYGVMIDDQLQFSTNVNTVNTGFHIGNQEWYIGTTAPSAPPTRLFAGKIAEFLLYGRKLNASEQTNVMAYLRQRCGMSPSP